MELLVYDFTSIYPALTERRKHEQVSVRKSEGM